MTIRLPREQQCAGKVKHATRRDARRARRQTPKDGGAHMHIYVCPWCRRFHIGHQPSDPYLDDIRDREHARSERLATIAALNAFPFICDCGATLAAPADWHDHGRDWAHIECGACGRFWVEEDDDLLEYPDRDPDDRCCPPFGICIIDEVHLTTDEELAAAFAANPDLGRKIDSALVQFWTTAEVDDG